MEPLSQLTLSTLFLQPPSPFIAPADPIAALNEHLSKQIWNYSTFITAAHLSRQAITSFEHDSRESKRLFSLWEIHLTSLIFAQELGLAQQEAKRLSVAMDSIVKNRDPKPQNVSLGQFPEAVPFSLRLLLIRLRSIGPTVQALSESYGLLWEVRQEFIEASDKQLIRSSITALSYGIGAILIAKREYSTFLTLAESINKDQNLKLLSVLVNLITGDWETAEQLYATIHDAPQRFTEGLAAVLRSTNPVLDPNKPDTGIQRDIHIEKLDDVFELIKEQLITGRIVCALCALFELQLRDSESNGTDIFHGEDDEPSRLTFALWKHKVSKLYAFE